MNKISNLKCQSSQSKILLREIELFKDQEKIGEILEKEEILQLFTSKEINARQEIIIYIITKKGKIINSLILLIFTNKQALWYILHSASQIGRPDITLTTTF